MKRKMSYVLFVIALIAAVALISGCASYQQPPQQTQQQQPTGAAKTVMITADGFGPATLEINAGDAVMFANRDTAPHRPASAQHPTHAVYPETGGCIGSKFDSCSNLAQGESWSFTFYQKGEWKYHDHLNCCTDARFFGTVIVR